MFYFSFWIFSTLFFIFVYIDWKYKLQVSVLCMYSVGAMIQVCILNKQLLGFISKNVGSNWKLLCDRLNIAVDMVLLLGNVKLCMHVYEHAIN